ncbi:DsbA family protein [Streptomyces erythrochromogenes]|uniref:DsbA family protein n=1 Tax=Streptomyces erythrochromogenes TaxID=285574 RepID=UPI0036B81514
MESTDTAVRERVHERHRRRRTLLVSLVAVAAVAAVALVGAGLVRPNKSEAGEAPSRLPAGTASDTAGVASGSGEVRIDLYFDYLCPSCRTTEQALAAQLDALRASGKVTLVHHPVTFLDSYSTPAGYSTRAASAAACAADQGKFEQYSAVLFDKQPPERGPGLSEAQLIAAGRDAGITDDSFANCLRERTYAPWATYVSDTAVARGIAATPTVTVNGRRVDVTGSDPGASLARAVSEAGR